MDITTAQAHLDAWLRVDLALTSGQAYTLPEGVSVTRVTPNFARERINYWQGIVEAYTSAASGGRSRVSLASFS